MKRVRSKVNVFPKITYGLGTSSGERSFEIFLKTRKEKLQRSPVGLFQVKTTGGAKWQYQVQLLYNQSKHSSV